MVGVRWLVCINTYKMIEHYGGWIEKRGTQRRKYTNAVCPLCDGHFVALLDNVIRGNTSSCGCQQRECHAYYNTPTYKSWQGMKERCDNEKLTCYSRYGGRGIEYDKKWKRFTGFLHDMGLCPDGYSLDRVNNDGNYCKENCRWATRVEQANNRRSNLIIEHEGVEQTFAEFCRKHDLDYKKSWWEYKRRGTSLDKLTDKR